MPRANSDRPNAQLIWKGANSKGTKAKTCDLWQRLSVTTELVRGETDALDPYYLVSDGDNSCKLSESFWHDSPPCPSTASVTDNQSGLREDPGVVRDSWLTLFQWLF
jgi:hypothetical protein